MSQVPVWVPIVVALLGFAGVVLTQALNVHTERRRWERERAAEHYEARANAYAELTGSLEALTGVLFDARRARENGESLSAETQADLRATQRQLQQSLGAVVLRAPEPVRTLVRDATLPNLRLATMLLDPDEDVRHARRTWDAGQLGYRTLRAAMRRDLGLDAEDVAGPETS